VFAVVLTGPPGAGKTTSLMALSDALVDDRIAHAAVDVDEIAWAYPFPSLRGRCEHLRAWREAHVRAGVDLVLVAEVVESPAHRKEVLAALGADDHLLVGLAAALATLQQRIVRREPAGWSGLPGLLDEARRFSADAELMDVDLRVDSERLSPADIADRIRSTAGERLRRRHG
jgi:hypothetical protein